MTNNDELVLKLKSAAESATKGSWRRTSTEFNGICVGPFSFTKEEVLARAVEKRDAIFISLANPANILALLAERDADKKRIKDLEQSHCGGALMEREEHHVAVVSKLVDRITELESISTAAEKLVRCKGRYHSEQNYRSLAALFGVKTPDLPPLDTEARTVSVKLPDCDYAAVQHMSGGSNDYCNGFVDGTQNAIKCVKAGADTAGINLEVEE